MEVSGQFPDQTALLPDLHPPIPTR